ncbi:hypothetical protein [Meiothermus rufus]|uniref:hypothetical protein n=1 Tax=Meiothermus rufus TaxID=604332 RepID=UPI0003F5BBBC|nr:hypothetical protein [Meiothermus rufus]
MGLDDLLGLLFLFFFIILPALQGLLRRGQQVPKDFEPDEIPLPGEKRPPTQPTPPAQASSPPASPTAAPSNPPAPSRPLVSSPPTTPRPKTPTSPRPKTLEEIERERLGRSRPRPVKEPPQPIAAKPTATTTKPTEEWALSVTPHAILNGVVWHQILAEPRSRYWRRVRRPKR